MEASPLPHKARGSKNHNTPGGLQSTATVLLLRLRATLHCPATAVVVPVGSLRWPGSFGGAGQTDSDATRKHWGAWHGSREKGTGQQNNLDTCTGTSASTGTRRQLLHFMSSAVACSCAPRGVRASRYKYMHLHLHLREQRSIMGLTGRVDTPLCREGACSLTMNCVGGLLRNARTLAACSRCGLSPHRIAGPSAVQVRAHPRAPVL